MAGVAGGGSSDTPATLDPTLGWERAAESWERELGEREDAQLLEGLGWEAVCVCVCVCVIRIIIHIVYVCVNKT